MENSILTSTKKNLGMAAELTAFDHDIVTHINASFFTLSQLGVISADGFMIEDEVAVWDDLEIPMSDLNAVKQYVYMKSRLAFDLPPTSFAIDALKTQIQELEWRLNVSRENEIPIPEDEEVEV